MTTNDTPTTPTWPIITDDDFKNAPAPAAPAAPDPTTVPGNPWNVIPQIDEEIQRYS